MDENAPGTSGSSAYNVERDTLAKVRNWLGEVSDQIERDRREARRRMLRSVLIIVVLGGMVTGLTATLVTKRTFKQEFVETNKRIQAELSGVAFAVNGINANLGVHDTRLSSLQNQLTNQLSTLTACTNGITELSQLKENVSQFQTELARMQRRLAATEESLKRISDTVNQMAKQTPIPGPTPRERGDYPEKPQPPANLKLEKN